MGVAVGVLLTAAGLGVFAVYRPRTRPRLDGSVVVQDRAAAVVTAGAHVRELTGIDVLGWQTFAVPSSEPGLLQQAHQLGIIDEVTPVLHRWGLLYGWRVRFCGPRDTVAIGIGGSGDVNFLQMSGRQRDAATALGRPTPPSVLPPSVAPHGAAVVHLGATGGSGPAPAVTGMRATNGETGSSAFVDEVPEARVVVTVESWDGRVLGVATQGALTVEGLNAERETGRRGRRRQRLAMAGMVLALLAGGLALVVAREVPPLGGALALGFVAFASVVMGEPRMFPRMVVFEFDDREPLASCRRRHARQTAMAGLLNGVFVMAGVAAGEGLLRLSAAPAAPSLAAQLGVGAFVACGWLGLTAAASSFLAARGRLAATAELPPAALRRLGYSWWDVVGASLQSSIGEEVLYRLVMVSLAWHLAGQPMAGVLVAAALWSATHDVGDVRPRMVRLVELFILGCVLGVLLVYAGLAATIAAHFVFNVGVLGWPLMAARSPRVTTAWR